MNFVLDARKKRKEITGKMHEIKHVCKNICLSIFKVNVIVVFLKIFPYHLYIRQVASSLKGEKITEKIYAPFELYIEDIV